MDNNKNYYEPFHQTQQNPLYKTHQPPKQPTPTPITPPIRQTPTPKPSPLINNKLDNLTLQKIVSIPQ